MNNRAFSDHIIAHLIEQGVSQFFIAPGSRSTSLAMAVAENCESSSIVHFDERGLAFCALGYGKGSGKAAAIITTSCSAVGNLFPAIMEAFLTNTPLIILTADRPPELRNVGSNQTLDQVKIFGDYVRYFADIPCPDARVNQSYLASLIMHAVRASRDGPVHLNCMLREPLIEEKTTIPPPLPRYYEVGVRMLENPEKWAELIQSWEKGIILAGTMQQTPEVLSLAKKLGYPVLADPSSNLRQLGRHPSLLPYYNTILEAKETLAVDGILHFGDRIVSKILANTLQAKEYCLVSLHATCYDPQHKVTHRLECSLDHFCQALIPLVKERETWCPNLWEQAQAIDDAFKEEDLATSEIEIVRTLLQKLDENEALFIANSMPIRDIDSYYFPTRPAGPLFTNRGTSGIDGNIATAAGIALGSGKNIFALIGDQAALHDLNSLALLKEIPHSVSVIIINNSGGGIFSFLPVNKHPDFLERYSAAAHSWTFEHAAKLFHLPYLQSFAKHAQSCIIELTSNRQENFLFHESLKKKLQDTCLSTSSAAL